MNYTRLAASAVLILLSACGGNADEAPKGVPIITDLTADPETVAPGETSTITWTASGNPTLTIFEDGRRPITKTGETSYVAQPTVTTTYVLAAENAAGRVQDEVTVNVTAAAPPPETPSVAPTAPNEAP